MFGEVGDSALGSGQIVESKPGLLALFLALFWRAIKQRGFEFEFCGAFETGVPDSDVYSEVHRMFGDKRTFRKECLGPSLCLGMNESRDR
jgi:hypothetical protein